MNGPKECRNGLSGAQLPSTAPSKVSEHIFLQRPLSRRANGPGLIILIPRQVDTNGHNKTLDPPPLQKWAEEGYAVALVASEDSVIKDNILLACDSLMRLQECSPKGDFGVISYLASHNVRTAIRTIDTIVAGVFYEDCEYEDISKPLLCHIAGPIPEEGKTQQKDKKNFYYPSARPLFTIPAHPDFSNAQASVSHTRTLAFLKPLMRGPYFDLEAIWEEHTMLEFMTRSPEKTMTTMVQEPYVNHIPTMTGGIGRERLTNFYRFHFIFNNPDDTAMELVSRTVGIDRVVDEFIFSFTHDKFIDWMYGQSTRLILRPRSR
ncbi:MAG: hypothetical protein M1822_005361 [Bathelium mastoideum]|nr:MAG: hypothetical protein M1822_005361 [Bathelium mastoideum]